MRWLLVAIVVFAARADEPDTDDPVGRMRAERAADSGVRTAEMQEAILREAESELLRTRGAQAGRNQLRVAGSSWVNIGPVTADYENNGSTYYKVDSGRARRILVDPRDANVVYLATSGGGVWKTRDALAPITASSGPHWAPLTDGIVSLSVGALAMNPVSNDSLVLGLGDPFDVQVPGYSILTSDDGGQSWSSAAALAGSYPTWVGVYTASSVRDLAFDPAGATVLAATDAGLFRHASGGVGAGWALVDVDTTTHDLQDCWSLAYAGPASWVLACRDTFNGGVGKIWRSTNDGKSWTDETANLGSSSTDVGRMTLASASQGPAQPFRVYALAANKGDGDQKDVFRSDDGGVHWNSLAMCGPGTCAARAPLNATDNQPDLDFTHGQARYNQMLVVDPQDANHVFIGGNFSLGRSTDGGNTWSVMTDWLPFTLQISNGGLDSTCGATPSTCAMPQYAHADWHTATLVHVGGSAYFYGGNDGGITRAAGDFLAGAPGAVSWEDKLNRGIVSHLVYSVASGKERPVTSCTGGGGDIVYGGFQDDGTRLRVLSGGTNYVGYNQIVGGDGFGVGLGCSRPGAAMGTQLLRTYVARIYTATDGGSFVKRVDETGTGLAPPIRLDRNLNFRMRVVADLSADFTYLTPLTEETSLAGHVYRSTDNGVSFTGIDGVIHLAAGGTSATFPKPLRDVAAHPRLHDTYAAVSGGRLYLTKDGGANWTESARAFGTTATNYLALAAVAFDPNDSSASTLFVGSPFASLNDGGQLPAAQPHLYKCTNAAVLGAICTPVSGNSGLPAVLPVNVVKVDPGDSSTVYVGTEIGLYRSTDGGATFSRYGTGLPLVSVTDVAVNADGSAIRVSTFGRGFWEIYPDLSAKGVAGSGDLDNSGVIDGFDLVREAAIEFTDRTTEGFDAAGDVVFNNVIDESDLAALLGKLGGTP